MVRFVATHGSSSPDPALLANLQDVVRPSSATTSHLCDVVHYWTAIMEGTASRTAFDTGCLGFGASWVKAVAGMSNYSPKMSLVLLRNCERLA